MLFKSTLFLCYYSDLWLSLNGLLSPLHRYCATTFTEIKNGYTVNRFPVQRLATAFLLRSRFTTFRQSYYNDTFRRFL